MGLRHKCNGDHVSLNACVLSINLHAHILLTTCAMAWLQGTCKASDLSTHVSCRAVSRLAFCSHPPPQQTPTSVGTRRTILSQQGIQISHVERSASQKKHCPGVCKMAYDPSAWHGCKPHVICGRTKAIIMLAVHSREPTTPKYSTQASVLSHRASSGRPLAGDLLQ